MFTQVVDLTKPITISDARKLRLRAESLAGLPIVDHGGFHGFRRLWAVERKHLPDVDVARGGGWRGLSSMKRSYQQPDPETTLRVIENASPTTEERRVTGEETA